MFDQDEIKEWVKVSHSNRVTIVTISLVQGSLSAKWSEKVLESLRAEPNSGRVTRPNIKPALKRARASANELLEDMRKTLAELDAEVAEVSE